MKTAKFLSARITQADLKDGPLTLSVEGATVDPYVDPKTSQTEEKLTLRFEGGRTLILNKTNLNVLIEGFGTDESEAWVGKNVTVAWDPNVAFGGRKQGGIRISVPPPDDRPY